MSLLYNLLFYLQCYLTTRCKHNQALGNGPIPNQQWKFQDLRQNLFIHENPSSLAWKIYQVVFFVTVNSNTLNSAMTLSLFWGYPAQPPFEYYTIHTHTAAYTTLRTAKALDNPTDTALESKSTSIIPWTAMGANKVPPVLALEGHTEDNNHSLTSFTLGKYCHENVKT